MRTKTIFHTVYGRMIDTLKMARKEQGMTQAQAGYAVGMSRNWIHKVERRELRLDIIQLVRLCRVYAVRCVDIVRQLEKELAEEGDSPLSFSYQTRLYRSDDVFLPQTPFVPPPML